MNQDRMYVIKAIELAKEGFKKGAGGPFGALIVRDGVIIGEAWNEVKKEHDPTAHAEVQALRTACKSLGTRRLEGATLYASCEPCPMCFSAVYFAGIKRIVYAASHKDAGEIAGFGMEKLYEELYKPIETRSMPTEQVERELGWEPFHLFQDIITQSSSK